MDEASHIPPLSTQQMCGVADARRIAAMLDLDTSSINAGALLPLGWHFPLLAGETRRSALRSDGFPGLGIEMPDTGLPRLLLLGREVAFLDDLVLGSEVERQSVVLEIADKRSASGPAAKVTLRHQLLRTGSSTPAIVETQSYFLLPAGQPRLSPTGASEPVVADIMKTVAPDQTMLFQYSALGFNSHRIHLDRDYVRDVEGYPDLIVNGGLTMLLLTEFLLHEVGVVPQSIKTRHVAPLFCGRPITLAANRRDNIWRLAAHDEMGRVAVEMELAAR